MKNHSKIFIYIFILIVAFLFGDMTRRVYFTPVSNPTTLTDNLPLANESSIKLELVDGKKLVIISLEDLQYITKKKKIMRTTVENIVGLFERLK